MEVRCGSTMHIALQNWQASGFIELATHNFRIVELVSYLVELVAINLNEFNPKKVQSQIFASYNKNQLARSPLAGFMM
jgi:hypothetical protein